MWPVIISVLYSVEKTLSDKILTFDINSKLPLAEPECFQCPNPECVYTRGNFSFPPELTFCYRFKSRNWVGSLYPFSEVIQFGKIRQDWTDLEYGFLYGTWDSGPWVALAPPGTVLNTWGALHKLQEDFPFQVWKHQCIAISLESGRLKLFINGKKIQEHYFENIKKLRDKIPRTADFAAVGCAYRSTGAKLMSMMGSVTDFQVFGSELDDETMAAVTGCRAFPQGDIVSWHKDVWFLNGSKSYTETSYLDLETNICPIKTTSHFFIPYLMNREPAGAHMCRKFSGTLAGFATKSEFNMLTHFLSYKNHLRSNQCIEKEEGASEEFTLSSWVAPKLVGQLYENPYTNQKLEYLPWAEGRPWGGQIACTMVNMKVRDADTDYGLINKAEIVDESCEDTGKGCITCFSSFPVMKIFVRGLCKESMFDRTYTCGTYDNGVPIYIGYKSSTIIYSHSHNTWTWFDRNKNTSIATSEASANSMMIGINKVDFSSVEDDCSKKMDEKVINIKLTTCLPGLFTCDDGQCVSIEVRCDQTPNCKDGSDERNCKMMIIEDNYNKKIAPFIFDTDLEEITPVEIAVSIDILQLLKFMEVDLEYILKFKLKLEWYDYRLTYWNLKRRRSANRLTEEEFEKIWMPYLIFKNTEKNEATVKDAEAEITLTREGNFTRSDDSIIEEINIFNGIENKIIFEKVYTKTFRCEYQLQLYPFDTQACITL